MGKDWVIGGSSLFKGTSKPWSSNPKDHPGLTWTNGSGRYFKTGSDGRAIPLKSGGPAKSSKPWSSNPKDHPGLIWTNGSSGRYFKTNPDGSARPIRPPR